MKKTRLILAALAAISLVGTMPVQAESAKEKAKKQFNESMKRFKKCAKLKCTRMEALKAGRDVIITLGTLLLIGYSITRAMSAPFQRFDVVKYNGIEWAVDEYDSQKNTVNLWDAFGYSDDPGQTLIGIPVKEVQRTGKRYGAKPQRPGAAGVSAVKSAVKKIRKAMKAPATPEEDDIVLYNGRKWVVFDVHTQERTVDLWTAGSAEFGAPEGPRRPRDIPFDQVQLTGKKYYEG